MRELTIAAGVVSALMELAVARGASRKTLSVRSRIDCPDFEDVDSRVPFSKYVALMRAGQELCNDPALALRFGEAVDASELSISHAVGAENIGDACAVTNRYASLGVEVELDGTGDRFQLRRAEGGFWLVDARRNPNDFPELTESTFARMVCTMRGAVGDRQCVTEVHVTHTEPCYRGEYQRIFGVPVVFGSSWNALRIDEALLATFQFPTPSRYVTSVLRDHAEELLEKLESSHSTRDRVESLLMPLLLSGDASMETIAGKLCCSRQTLFRALKVEGVTFEQVLDELRHKLALNYLNAKHVSVKETARRVGYSDPASFSRAFKRWTGASPRVYVARGGLG
ncbi:MAG: AraC family transcriptional regulator [Gemmatimonadetes bacterium]|nr:AraC family transcriptional regulator [Gemmatimonadota bacterium]